MKFLFHRMNSEICWTLKTTLPFPLRVNNRLSENSSGVVYERQLSTAARSRSQITKLDIYLIITHYPYMDAAG